ncbi:acyl-CoA thioesterase [Roseivirga sp. BDSF3-8]|uniref:acyl-CoA thioesterase n=1 Tax=Roseivirga sp. BDSF3-8 TaxID=3241598 RepID=UPI0035318328
MSRTKLEMPGVFCYRQPIQVRISDINYGNHVSNEVYLSYMHEARKKWLESLGYEDEVNGVEGVGLIMADAVVVYRAETFYGETVLVDIAVEDIQKTGFDLLYRLSGQKNGKELTRGKTSMVCFAYEERKVAQMPDRLKKRLETLPHTIE